MSDQIERVAGILRGASNLDESDIGRLSEMIVVVLRPELQDAERLSVLCDPKKTYWLEVRRQPHGTTLYSGIPQFLREEIDAARQEGKP